MKKFIFLFVAFFCTMALFAQDKFFTKSGKIGFDATTSTSPEEIKGVNKTVTCVLDSKTGAIQFAVLMTGFEFERALMEEHFNENYVESAKFPRSEFKGQIDNNATVKYSIDGQYSVKVKGKLSMHGVTRDVETTATITVKAGKITAAGNFNVQLSDFKIAIPTLVADKVAKTAVISITCILEPLKS
jgi:uncharacterized protein YdeI (BOF family)